MGTFLKKKRLFKLISNRIWELFSDIKFDYEQEIDQKVSKIKKQDEYLEKMKKLKETKKLSKRKLNELKEKEKLNERLKMKEEKKNEKKQLHKTALKEMDETKAVVDNKKTKNTAKQILLKIFYIIFKVFQNYSCYEAFDWCIRSMNKNSRRVDPMFLKSIQSELKSVFDYFKNPECQIEEEIKLKKKLLVLDAIIKVSQQKNTGVEIEQFYSLKCFYSILLEILQNFSFLLSQSSSTLLKFLYLLENLLLTEKLFNEEVIENFLALIMLLIFFFKDHPNNFLTCLVLFLKNYLSKYSKVYINIFDEHESLISEKELINFNTPIELLKAFKKKNLINVDPFIKLNDSFPFKEIFSVVKLKLGKDQNVSYLLTAILENKNLSQRFIGKKPSQIYKEISQEKE
jgi:hypothetical protein